MVVIGRINIKKKYQDKEEKANINNWLNEGELSEENKVKQFQLQEFQLFTRLFFVLLTLLLLPVKKII